MTTLKNIQEYHQRTKHQLDRYARSPGFMDWRNQPNPFRFFEGARRLQLPLLGESAGAPYGVLFDAPVLDPQPFELQTLAALLELSMGLSAWKQYGTSEWSLRMNPSSGNLHPTECYLLLPACEGVPACIAHYNAFLHCLEIRSELDAAAAETLNGMEGCGIILSSVFWREAWKYGERAFRYTQHDIGHALGGLRFSAALNGWKLSVRPEVSDATLDRLLGFQTDRQVPGEQESADCFCWVSFSDQTDRKVVEWLSELQAPVYTDTPNQLSPAVVDWPVIEAAAGLVASPGYPRQAVEASRLVSQESSSHSAESMIRQRRSAQAFEPATSGMPAEAFREILSATLPRTGAPFDVLATATAIHLFVFVHRVEGIQAGLYCLLRNDSDLQALRSCCNDHFLWQQVDQQMPLYLLQPGDYRAVAESVSCHQAIAGDSAFSLGMLARFEPLLSDAPWLYPSLFWEAGLVGQVLYLEAEDKGFRGTGIGCYFDDVMHELLGMKGGAWQDVYHFTIGSPVEDARLQTKPAYHHLAKLRDMQND